MTTKVINELTGSAVRRVGSQLAANPDYTEILELGMCLAVRHILENHALADDIKLAIKQEFEFYV